eukprot:Blabericola_migrator_1__12087@NODE_744_length_6668_cov_95_131495_g534_i0_p2_GENE_NODE_744_length_6668_cov_95_131495_g534_i0NODE_744_length_6668_cov_95_131495_g534_i0_p2_ORF_typecomplete_len425_score70_06_NODE_744_length_6668_cov_95_131495_g534_i037975071
MKSVSLLAPLLLLDPCEGQLHFASLGSWGRNNNDQKAVAQTLKAHAHRPPLSFIVSPGSNFMEGISDLEDRRWRTHYEDIYEGIELNLPFFVALGVNDWDGNVTAMVLRTNETYGMPISKGRMPWAEENTEEYVIPSNEEQDREPQHLPKTKRGPRWTLPNFYYHYTQSFPDTSIANSLMASPEVSVFFIFVDTKILGASFPVDPMTSRHWHDLRAMIKASSKTYDWVIVVGDQAIFSSGSKGPSSYFKSNLRPLLRDHLVDAYISGSDEDMEIIEDGSLVHINCGSASGGSMGRMTKHDGSVAFSNKAGYCLHTLTSRHFTTSFVDGYSGKQIFEYTKLRNHRPKRFADRLLNLNSIPAVTYLPLPPGVGGAPGGIIGGLGRQPNTIFVLLCGTFGLISAIFIAGTAAATMGKRFKRYSSHHH